MDKEFRCYAETYCKKDRAECGDLCGGYRVLNALFELSRIPLLYQYNIPLIPGKADLKAYEALDEFMKSAVEHVKAGDNLYIWSEYTGNGKTSWACKIMAYYFRKIAFHTSLENEGLYIYVPSFLEDYRNSYDERTEDFDEVLTMVKGCNLLIIDDLGEGNPTEWVREQLTSIINNRVNNGLSNIITSGLSPDQLGSKLGAKIKSRVMMRTQEIHLVSEDRRGVNG